MVAKATCPHLLFMIVGKSDFSIDAFSASPATISTHQLRKIVELRLSHVANKINMRIIKKTLYYLKNITLNANIYLHCIVFLCTFISSNNAINN